MYLKPDALFAQLSVHRPSQLATITSTFDRWRSSLWRTLNITMYQKKSVLIFRYPVIITSSVNRVEPIHTKNQLYLFKSYLGPRLLAWRCLQLLLSAGACRIHRSIAGTQRIRGFLKWYALYKSTFYLLTYLLTRRPQLTIVPAFSTNQPQDAAAVNRRDRRTNGHPTVT